MAYIGQSLTEGTRRVYTYVATASQTTFNAVYGVGAVDVYQNGVLLQPSDYTATNGTSVVLGTGAALDDEITIVCHNTFSVADTVSASQGGTFNGPVSVTGAFTSQGIDDNATSTAMTLDSSGNLLVGTTDSAGTRVSATTGGGTVIQPSSYSVFSRETTASNQAVMTINNTGVDAIFTEFYKDGTTVGSIGSNTSGTRLHIGSGNAGLSFAKSASNAIIPWDTTANAIEDATLNLGGATARFKDFYLSGGVYLGGTGSANKLDDYEEGTWTPVLSSTGSAPTIGSYSTQAGTYTKVGNLVVARCRIRATVTSAGSGYPKVVGLPFSNAGGYSGVTMGLQNLMMIDTATYDRTKFPQGSTYGSSTEVAFYYMTYVTNNNNYVEFTVVYHTTA